MIWGPLHRFGTAVGIIFGAGDGVSVYLGDKLIFLQIIGEPWVTR